MCEICHESPCLSRCPNETSEKLGKCVECGTEIYNNQVENWIDKDDNLFCSVNCALKYYDLKVINTED